MTATATATPTPTAGVSDKCELGKHHRCLGTVALPRPVDGRTLAPCACKAPGCDHGPAGSHP